MPHVGKQWPILIPGWSLQLRPGPTFNIASQPPYAWRVVFASGSGALAIKWEDSERFSEPGFLNDDGWPEWRVNFDGDPDIYFRIVGSITDVDEFGVTQTFPYRLLDVTYHEDGTQWGRRRNWNSNRYVQDLGDATFTITGLLDIVNPTQFVGFGGSGMQLFQGAWGDFPDYHPYRH